jgi:hypothetical protein
MGFLIVGDFNSVDTNLFNKYLSFKQVVTSPTRGSNILDKIFTNCNIYYSVPQILPPLGKSDHNTVLLTGKTDLKTQAGYHTSMRRQLNFDTLNRIACDLLNFSWQQLYLLNDSQKQADLFYSVVNGIINRHAPLHCFRLKKNDRPWITLYFKQLIARRNDAFHSGHKALFRKLRNQANRVSKSLKTQYYLEKVQHLKAKKCSNWWRHIKQLSGASYDDKHDDCFDSLILNEQLIDSSNLSDIFNDHFVSVTADCPPLNSSLFNHLRDKLDHVPDDFVVSEYSVFRALKYLKIDKSSCDDILSNRLLVDLAAPICSIINSSIRQGIVPTQWKIARVVPIPKVFPPLSLDCDFRPISITSGISKIAESFMCQFFTSHFDKLSDPNQFGSTNNRSTTHALIKLADLFFKSADSPDTIIRILFVDFAKAFDLVNHNVLLRKFQAYDFPPHITAWSMSFLHERKQFVEVRNNKSSCSVLRAGAPQGTLSGPYLFKLLINDLTFDIDFAKYVDDTTVVSVSTDPNDYSLQFAADRLSVWCDENSMRINTKKTKEMLINFSKSLDRTKVSPLTINGSLIERVSSFKLLGVIFSSDLSWSQHVSYILNKVAKRYFIIFQLARIGINPSDIISIYSAIIRSVLEYACPVWHCGLTANQSDDLERVQRRFYE